MPTIFSLLLSLNVVSQTAISTMLTPSASFCVSYFPYAMSTGNSLQLLVVSTENKFVFTLQEDGQGF